MEGDDNHLNGSDSDESIFLMERRRQASDEDDDGSECEDRERLGMIDGRVRIGSGYESDALGEAELYDDEEYYTQEDDLEVVAEVLEFDAVQTGLHSEDQRKEENNNNTEPFVVPTSGAFYMHDDRSRDTGGGRPQTRHWCKSGGKLWETKNEQKWGHDKFEEVMQHEGQNQEFNERRTSKGLPQGHSKNQDCDSGHVKGTHYRPLDNSSNQNGLSTFVRGRGHKRCEPLRRSNDIIPPTKSKQSGQFAKTASNTNSGKILHASYLHCVPFAPKKHVSAQGPSSASPMFYPGGSTCHDISVIRTKDVKPGGANRRRPMSLFLGENFQMSESNVFQQGNTVVHPVGPDRFAFEPIHPVGGHCLTNLPSNSSVILSTFVAGSPLSLVQTQCPVQPWPPQSTVLPLQGVNQQLSQHSEVGYEAFSEASALNSSESGALVSAPERKSKHAMYGKRTGIPSGNGRDDLLYGGPHCGQNFSAMPATFPVMQFDIQHHGVLGFSPVCTCPTCYAVQTEPSFGNSEMICKEMGKNMANGGRIPTAEPELVNHEVWQQKVQPRRHSKINFDQKSE